MPARSSEIGQPLLTPDAWPAAEVKSPVSEYLTLPEKVITSSKLTLCSVRLAN
jgi:hypothetical protein